ncbi:unnamed protein product [Dicrocoelium dendriticum]|nr:unnamed protein product [Dicrocoelium dendriticum]
MALCNFLLNLFRSFSPLLLDRSSEPNIGLPFELWLRIYSPSLRDCLVSRGCVTVAILSELINQNNSDADRSAHYTHCSIHLRDVHLERTNGRLNLGLTYSMRDMKPPIRKTTRSPPQLITFNSSMPSQSASEHFSYPDVQLIQNVCLPGVRMTVQLHGLTGLAPSSKSPRSVGFCGHVRLHCLLIRNTGSVGSESCQCLVLGSAASNHLRGSYFANNLDTNLEVLLPFSWRCLSTGSPAEPYRDLNVIELLLNGEEMLPFHSAAQSFSKWALIVQVDLWQQSSVDNIAVDLLNSEKSNFLDMGWSELCFSEVAICIR